MSIKDLYHQFKKYEVQADNLRDFCDKYHNYDYSETDYLFHKDDIEKSGYTIINRHDSITGETVSYYGEV